jgi:hypothetical protein
VSSTIHEYLAPNPPTSEELVNSRKTWSEQAQGLRSRDKMYEDGVSGSEIKMQANMKVEVSKL